MNEVFKSLAEKPFAVAGLLLIFGGLGATEIVQIDPMFSNLAVGSGFGLLVIHLIKSWNSGSPK